MKRALLWLLLVALALIASVLTRLNLGLVNFHYYFGSLELPLAVLLLIVLISGAILGLMLTLGWSLASQAERRRLRRTLAIREQEIRNLREIPIRDRH